MQLNPAGVEMKKIAKKVLVGLDSKKSFTEVDKDRDMKNGIGVQMMDLNPIEIKKALKEIRGWKSKTPLNKMLEKNKLINIIIR